MIENQELLAELQADLKEQGIEATEEEIRAAVEKLQSDELSEENLEEVAGGGKIIDVIIRIGKELAFCPKCCRVYVRKKGHHCARKRFPTPRGPIYPI